MRLFLATTLVFSLLAPLIATRCKQGSRRAVEVSGLCSQSKAGSPCQARHGPRREPSLCQAHCVHESLRHQDRLPGRSVQEPVLVRTGVVAPVDDEACGRGPEGRAGGGREPPSLDSWPEAPLVLLL